MTEALSSRKTYYKVLTVDRNSAWVGTWRFGTPLKIALKYPAGEWVQPVVEGSKLLVFDSEQAAERWSPYRTRTGDYVIVRCKVRAPLRCRAILYTRLDNIGLHCARFWEAANRLKRPDRSVRLARAFSMDDVPLGTVACDAVKCLE